MPVLPKCLLAAPLLAASSAFESGPQSDATEMTAGENEAAAPLLHHTYSSKTLAGSSLSIEYTLSLPEEAEGDATNIEFTHNLDAVVSGLSAQGLPATDICGINSTVSGISEITLNGGVLSPGSTCSFEVTAHLPSSAVPGHYFSQTSEVGADIDGQTISGLPSASLLEVMLLELGQSFLETAVPGHPVTLQFELNNTWTAPVEDLVFVQNLDDTVSDLRPLLPLPEDVCGDGSRLHWLPPVLALDQGALAVGETCSFSIELELPEGVVSGIYPARTGLVRFTSDGTPRVNPGFGTNLVVEQPGYAVGGSVSGLALGASTTLTLNGAQTIAIAGDGDFEFSEAVIDGSTYAVAIIEHPDGQFCLVDQPSGIVDGAAVSNIEVHCQDFGDSIFCDRFECEPTQ